MTRRQGTLILIIYAITVIPLVHYFAPMFYPAVPQDVATSGGSIMGKTNVYIQLIPYAFAWLSAPLVLIWVCIRLFKKL